MIGPVPSYSTVASSDAEPKRRDRGAAPHSLVLALSAGVGLVVGGLTQLGQTYLPQWLNSLANSGAPWVLIAFLVALLSRAAWVAAGCGVLALVCLEAGYVVVAGMRGFASSDMTVAFWLTAAIAFGPVVGSAAYFLRIREGRAGPLLGGLVAGIVSGEGLVAYVTVRETTTPGYWIAQVLVGLVMLALVGKRTRSPWVVAGFVTGVGALIATRFVPMLGA